MPRLIPFLRAALVLASSAARLCAHDEWNNLHLTFNSKDAFVYPFDGRSPKVAVALLNHNPTFSPEILLTLNVNGVRQDAGGFATFPNGGSIAVPPDDFGIASAWTAGVYEGRVVTPPAVGETKEFTFDFVFSLAGPRAPGAVDHTVSRKITFTNLGENPVLAGAFGASGTVRFPTIAGSPPAANLRVEVATPVSPWLRIATGGAAPGAGPAFTFSTPLPARNDWHVRLSADGYETRVIALGLFSEPRTPLDVTLTPAAAPDLDYRRIAAIATPTGFWRGAVSESEGTLAVFPAQENWKATATPAEAQALRTSGKVYKYKFDGTKLWEHTPGWETWAGDMTPDGRFVAYAYNPGNFGGVAPPAGRLVLLDGATGAVLWSKTAIQTGATTRAVAALEVALSPDGRWIALGSPDVRAGAGAGVPGGQVLLLDRATGNFAWAAPASGASFGQVRALRFSADSQFLFCGSGDSYLRKIRVSDGAVLWRTFVGGWPFVNGMNLSGDGQWIATGTKSFDTALIRASDGRQMWMTGTQVLDAEFSPDGRHIATFGGHVFRAADGSLAGMAKSPSVTRFTPDGRWILRFDRRLTLHDLGGKQLRDFGDSTVGPGPGEQSQWAYLTRDGRYAIIIGRDLAAPPQTGIAIYERQAPSAAAVRPAITTQPLAQAAAPGGAVTLHVSASGTAPLAYQWRRNGADLPDRNSPALALAALTEADAGSYTCVVTNAAGSTTSAAAALALVTPDPTNPARLTNLSVRTVAGPGAQTLIVGFTIGGGGAAINKRLLLRAAGPSLGAFGVVGTLADPRLALFAGPTQLGANDNWAGNADVLALAGELGAFPFASATSRDAALAALPAAGAYTMQLTSADATSGTALAEIYDGTTVFRADTPRLVNISARSDVLAGAPLVAGFVVAGQAARTVLVRGIGPTLASIFGIAGALADPQLTLFRDTTQIAANDNWHDSPNAVAIAATAPQVGAFVLPTTSRDAAVLLTLPPGNYSAQVTGANGTSGNALVEVYEVP
jgi:outer membrane protein assembly factor BamB